MARSVDSLRSVSYLNLLAHCDVGKKSQGVSLSNSGLKPSVITRGARKDSLNTSVTGVLL